jgi:hypothetical protein
MILGSGYPSFKNTISTWSWGQLSSITYVLNLKIKQLIFRYLNNLFYKIFLIINKINVIRLYIINSNLYIKLMKILKYLWNNKLNIYCYSTLILFIFSGMWIYIIMFYINNIKVLIKGLSSIYTFLFSLNQNSVLDFINSIDIDSIYFYSILILISIIYLIVTLIYYFLIIKRNKDTKIKHKIFPFTLIIFLIFYLILKIYTENITEQEIYNSILQDNSNDNIPNYLDVDLNNYNILSSNENLNDIFDRLNRENLNNWHSRISNNNFYDNLDNNSDDNSENSSESSFESGQNNLSHEKKFDRENKRTIPYHDKNLTENISNNLNKSIELFWNFKKGWKFPHNYDQLYIWKLKGGTESGFNYIQRLSNPKPFSTYFIQELGNNQTHEVQRIIYPEFDPLLYLFHLDSKVLLSEYNWNIYGKTPSEHYQNIDPMDLGINPFTGEKIELFSYYSNDPSFQQANINQKFNILVFNTKLEAYEAWNSANNELFWKNRARQSCFDRYKLENNLYADLHYVTMYYNIPLDNKEIVNSYVIQLLNINFNNLNEFEIEMLKSIELQLNFLHHDKDKIIKHLTTIMIKKSFHDLILCNNFEVYNAYYGNIPFKSSFLTTDSILAFEYGLYKSLPLNLDVKLNKLELGFIYDNFKLNEKTSILEFKDFFKESFEGQRQKQILKTLRANQALNEVD